jgi:hypothetical protein
MTQIDIHTKFIIFVSVAPQQEQGKVDIESKTYSKKVHGRVLPELPSLAPSRKVHGGVPPEPPSLSSSKKVHGRGRPAPPSLAPSRKVHGGVVPGAPSLAPSRNSMKDHGWVLPENIFFSKALCLDSVKTSSTHKIESDQSDDDMEYSLFGDVKGK